MQSGMSFFPGHWACLMSLRVSAGNAVTDAVWVQGGGGKRTAESCSREVERVLVAAQYGGRQGRVRTGGVNIFCRR